MTTQAFSKKGFDILQGASIKGARVLGKAVRGADMVATKIAPVLGATWRVVSKVGIAVYDMVRDDVVAVAGFIRKHKWQAGVTVASAVVGGMATSTMVGATVVAAILSMVSIVTVYYLIALRKKQAMEWRTVIAAALLSGAWAFLLPWITMVLMYVAIFGAFFAFKGMLLVFVQASALFMI